MALKGTLVVAQSGGPTTVINSSLCGVVEAARRHGEIDVVLAAKNGILGILREELMDLYAEKPETIAALRRTPAAAAGSCRYKLKKLEENRADYERILEVFKAHNVRYFIYCGGNDSMDTADKVARLARATGLDLVAVGVAKTIDNDLGDSEFRLIDHTPGYGSVARFWAYNVQNANEENMGSRTSEPVLVIQVMGRKTGFIPAAARLADPRREMPLQIYMPESGLTLAELTDNVNDELGRSGRSIVVVSEGFEVGDIGELKDAFGHTEYGASMSTVQQVVVNHLNKAGLQARGAAFGQVVGTDQRATMIYASTVDLDEAYKVGQNAVLIAAKYGSGYMSTILRRPGLIYAVDYDKAPLEEVANSERRFPKQWLAPNRIDVTDDFVRYARPLIGEDWVSVPVINGVQRYARFQRVFAGKKLPAYVPEAHRVNAVTSDK